MLTKLWRFLQHVLSLFTERIVRKVSNIGHLGDWIIFAYLCKHWLDGLQIWLLFLGCHISGYLAQVYENLGIIFLMMVWVLLYTF